MNPLRWTLIRQKFPLGVPGSLVLLETFSDDSPVVYINVFVTSLDKKATDMASE